MDAEEAMRRLKEGNARFVKGERKQYDFPLRRKEVEGGQKPFVTIVTCSDSRVIPEYVFDANIGEIFKIHTAGNVLGDIGMGSVEYGVGHLHTPLLVILGHSKCGAVTATCGGGHAEGHIASIVKKIAPAAEAGGKDVEESCCINMENVKKDLMEGSEVVRKAVDEGAVRIACIKYFLETGEAKEME